jgi:quinol monooxygenase YgiN
VGRFAQHTTLVATRGNAERLVAKFLESVELQRENPACELMVVSRSPDDQDVVYLTEVWSSESEWEAARTSPLITAWAKDMPSLVAAPPRVLGSTRSAGKACRSGGGPLHLPFRRFGTRASPVRGSTAPAPSGG